jgi:hypothetical protein
MTLEGGCAAGDARVGISRFPESAGDFRMETARTEWRGPWKERSRLAGTHA